MCPTDLLLLGLDGGEVRVSTTPAVDGSWLAVSVEVNARNE
jgi:hypothetical protein